MFVLVWLAGRYYRKHQPIILMKQSHYGSRAEISVYHPDFVQRGNMHTRSVALWKHDHTFGQEIIRSAEKNTRLVIAITGTMMIVEIVGGILFGSMALLADGLHMGSHAAALGISAAAYLYARKYARDTRFSFGTGKVNGLAGYTSAIILMLFALSMAWKSALRFFNPVGMSSIRRSSSLSSV
jgi:Co/Zn/Cd efflux system component